MCHSSCTYILTVAYRYSLTLKTALLITDEKSFVRTTALTTLIGRVIPQVIRYVFDVKIKLNLKDLGKS